MCYGTTYLHSLVNRLGMFRTAPTDPGDDVGGPPVEPGDPEESTRQFCLWVPILVSVAILRWVTKRLNKWIKKCKGWLKIFCWIVTIIVIIIVVAVLVIVTLVWWVYVCGEEASRE